MKAGDYYNSPNDRQKARTMTPGRFRALGFGGGFHCEHADCFDYPPATSICFRDAISCKSLIEGETHGFETISSQRIPEKQRRIGRWFVGDSGHRDRPNTGIPAND